MINVDPEALQEIACQENLYSGRVYTVHFQVAVGGEE